MLAISSSAETKLFFDVTENHGQGREPKGSCWEGLTPGPGLLTERESFSDATMASPPSAIPGMLKSY